jgi:hypothetical protein
MFVWNHPKMKKHPKKQGKFVAKIPMKMIFIDEAGRAFEFVNGEFIYRFCTFIVDKSKSLEK